jgi:mRNA interferase MazF
MAVGRFEVHLVNLDPTVGHEIKKTRPCVVVSPDELNEHLGTLVVAPMTTGGHAYPFRIPCRFQKKDGYIVRDLVRSVDRRRIVKRLGKLTPSTLGKALGVLREMFAE